MSMVVPEGHYVVETIGYKDVEIIFFELKK